MQAKYDVVVVGAGPAGSVAAQKVASSGYKTLLLDRRREIGVPVQCGEYLPSIREMHEMFPKCERLQKLGRIPRSVVTNKTTEMRLYSPRLHEYVFPLESRVIDRALFDKHLATKAQDAGAYLSTNSRVLEKFRKNRLKVRTSKGIEEVSGKVIIGADGPRSTIAQYLGFSYRNTMKDISQSLQYVIGDIPIAMKEPMMFFGHKVAPGGYAWIIPKTDSVVNVGFGLRNSFMRPGTTLVSYLDNLISNKGIFGGALKEGRILSRVGASIPVGGPLKRTYNENTILIGDAAGHVMASNGGGIPTALAGGSIAGEIVAQHLENGLSLSAYETLWKREFGTQLYSALATLRIADVMMRDDTLTEIAMRISGARFLEDVIKCRVPSPLSFGTPLLTSLMQLL
ncbi:MAG: geranylgeranyl reductase family protein [Candidatus Thorarchaeota archaeon]